MARPREFEIDDAVGRAMEVFWSHGYDGSSLPALLEGMGLTRGSLYKAFTDKKTLFLDVLKRYEVEAVQPATQLLSTGPADGLARISMLFNGVLGLVADGDSRGCLLCSAAAGAASVDAQIAQIVHHQLDQMRAGFQTALAQSVAHGDASDAELRALAEMLVTQYVGMRVLVRAGASPEALAQSVAALERLLGAPRV